MEKVESCHFYPVSLKNIKDKNRHKQFWIKKLLKGKYYQPTTVESYNFTSSDLILIVCVVLLVKPTSN